MRSFAQKQIQPQKRVSFNLARSHTATSEKIHHEHPILQLEGTSGNQANAKELKAGPANVAATTRFAHDFSQIPVCAKTPAKIQPMLTINIPGDIYEQEADRVADQVMRMPEPMVRRCTCGGIAAPDGECAACRAKRLGLQRVPFDPLPISEAPPIVHEVLNSSGLPRGAGPRKFMEEQFGYDFSQVRVHTDVQAAESARAVNAWAYTVGQDMVFSAGQYTPGPSSGRNLLTHELVHVLQQTRSVDMTQRRSSGTAMMQRQQQPTPPFSQIYRQAIAELRQRFPLIGQILQAAGSPNQSGYRLIRRIRAQNLRTTFFRGAQLTPSEVFLRVETGTLPHGRVAMYDPTRNIFSPPQILLTVTIDDSQANNVNDLTRTLYHEMVHILLFIESNLQRRPTSRVARSWQQYLSNASTLPLYTVLRNDIRSFIPPDLFAEDILTDLLQEHFTHRAETRAFGRTTTTPSNRTMASIYVREQLGAFDPPSHPPSIAVITSRTEALFDAIDQQFP